MFRRAKLESVRQRKPVSVILGEAIERYLTAAGRARATGGVVAGTWAVLKLDRRTVDRLIANEERLLDA